MGFEYMHLSCLPLGSKGGISLSFSFCAPVYTKLFKAYYSHDLETARKIQTVVRQACGVSCLMLVSLTTRYRSPTSWQRSPGSATCRPLSCSCVRCVRLRLLALLSCEITQSLSLFYVSGMAWTWDRVVSRFARCRPSRRRISCHSRPFKLSTRFFYERPTIVILAPWCCVSRPTLHTF
jgi:hypothetical protein